MCTLCLGLNSPLGIMWPVRKRYPLDVMALCWWTLKCFQVHFSTAVRLRQWLNRASPSKLSQLKICPLSGMSWRSRDLYDNRNNNINYASFVLFDYYCYSLLIFHQQGITSDICLFAALISVAWLCKECVHPAWSYSTSLSEEYSCQLSLSVVLAISFRDKYKVSFHIQCFSHLIMYLFLPFFCVMRWERFEPFYTQ